MTPAATDPILALIICAMLAACVAILERKNRA